LTIESIVCDPSLEVPQKSERIVELLAAQPNHGVPASVACLLATDDERVAAFVADYLAIIPDTAADKTRAAERLRGAGVATFLGHLRDRGVAAGAAAAARRADRPPVVAGGHALGSAGGLGYRPGRSLAR